MGIIAESIFTLTSKGILNQVLNENSGERPGRSNNVHLIMNEIMPLSLFFIIMVVIVYAILYYKNKSSIEEKDEQDEFFYRSLYLFLVWCGFIFILYVAKIPYFRTMVIGATVLPLIYLFLLGLSKLLDSITIPRYFIAFPSIVILYSVYVNIHNIDLMNKIIKDFQKQIIIAQKTNTDLIVPLYDAPFKQIYLKLGNKFFGTSEMDHAHIGTAEEKQKEGMKIFFHTLSLNALGTLEWGKGFYNFTGKIDKTNFSITNKY